MGASQRRWAARPRGPLVKTNATVARSLRLNEKVVPTGGVRLCLAMMIGSVLPSRHLLADWRTEEMAGAAAVENTDTLRPFAVASSRPFGLNATDPTPDAVGNGEPATGVSIPVLGCNENTDTLATGRVPNP